MQLINGFVLHDASVLNQKFHLNFIPAEQRGDDAFGLREWCAVGHAAVSY